LSNLRPTERWAYFDCFSGLSGDMTLGALIDLGLEAPELERLLNALKLGELRLEVRQVAKSIFTWMAPPRSGIIQKLRPSLRRRLCLDAPGN
jgi:hypothetical protein